NWWVSILGFQHWGYYDPPSVVHCSRSLFVYKRLNCGVILCIIDCNNLKGGYNMSKRLQVTLKDEMSEKLDELAKHLGVSKSAVIALALQDFDKKHKNR
ncbi:CopG family transcriptional regulator, partial [Staphylococcus capitis]